jgi:hypothetical protein
MGGREVEVSGDSALAAFPTAKRAAHAAVAAQRAVAAKDWPNGLRPAISVGLHSGQAGSAWSARRPRVALSSATPPKVVRSSCRRTANLLQDEDLGGLSIRDLGEQQMKRTQRVVRAHELVVSWVAETT